MRKPPLTKKPFSPGAGFGGWAFVVFAVALIVRLIHLWQVRRAPFIDLLLGDARSYDAWARTLAAGDWFGGEVFYQAPLYPYFLGAIYALGHGSLSVVRVCQVLIGATSCVLLADAGRRFFSKPAGVAAGLLLGLYAPAIFADGSIQKSVLDLFFVCLVLWLLSGVSVRPRASLCGWAGLATGCLALTRENALVFAPVVLVWLFVRHRMPQRRGLAFAGAYLLGLAAALLPVALRNQYIGGEFHLTTAQLGPNLYIGNHPEADGTYAPLRAGRGDPQFERRDATELAEAATGRRLTPGDVSAYWTRRAMSFVVSQPGAWLRLMGRKLALAVNAVELGDSDDQYTVADWSAPLRLTGYVCHFGVIAPLGVLGMWLTWPRRKEIWLLHAMLAVYAAGLVAFYVFGRYRLPMAPLLMLFAGAGLAGVLQFAREASRARIVAALAVVVGAAVFCNWPIVSRDAMRAVMLGNVGNALVQQEKPEAAIACYRESLRLDPGSAETHHSMGNALAACGDLDGAMDAYGRALQLAPGYLDARNSLANLLAAQDRFAEAIHQFEEVLRTDPHHVQAVNNLGTVYSRQGHLDKAVAQFEQALRIAPDYVQAARNLANALVLQGRTEEAVRRLREALRQTPESAEILDQTAWILATQDGGAPADATEAIRLAERACAITRGRDAGCLDTLAAAYAAAGRFDLAITTADRAIAAAATAGDEEQVRAIEQRRELYRQGTPYRQPATTRAVTNPT